MWIFSADLERIHKRLLAMASKQIKDMALLILDLSGLKYSILSSASALTKFSGQVQLRISLDKNRD